MQLMWAAPRSWILLLQFDGQTLLPGRTTITVIDHERLILANIGFCRGSNPKPNLSQTLSPSLPRFETTCNLHSQCGRRRIAPLLGWVGERDLGLLFPQIDDHNVVTEMCSGIEAPEKHPRRTFQTTGSLVNWPFTGN